MSFDAVTAAILFCFVLVMVFFLLLNIFRGGVERMVLFACFFVCFFVLSLLFLAFTLYVRMGGRGKFINTNDIFFSPKDINKENI